jgi:putative ATP-binding cassette transporter
VLVQRPDIIVLDEATSALDPASQDDLMRLLFDRLPNATLISVAHRPELEAFHNRKLMLEAKADGARLVRDVYLASKAPKRGRGWRWRIPRRGKAA